MAGALPSELQEVVLLRLASDSDASFMAGASILVGLGELEKASLTKGVEECGVILVVRAIVVGLFETISGLMLQAALFALTSEYADEPSRKKQLLPLVIPSDTTLKMVKDLLHGFKRMGQVSREGDFAGGCGLSCDFVIPSVVFPVGALAAMTVGTMRVFFTPTRVMIAFGICFLGAWSFEAASASCLS